MSALRPRLAILGCRGIPARYGGFETFAEELALRLAARGFEVTVYCEEPPSGPAFERHGGVALEYVRVPRLGPLSALVYDLRALRRARARHEVVYMLGYGAGAFLGLGRRPGNAVWVNMDGLEWRRAKWGWLARTWLRGMERAALRRADRVVFDSDAVRRVVAEGVAGFDQARALVIEYGARLDHAPDPGVVSSLGLRAREYFLLVARIEPENHVREILAAHARSDVTQELLVVGDVERAGRYGAACRAAAGKRVRFLGSLFDARTLFALRDGCLAALHGHSVGGTNPALLEAMAAGAPVLAHDNVFNREVLGDGGLFFASEAELLPGLRAAAVWSAEERARRGAAHRARIAERYTWERITDAYAAALTGAAPEEPAAPARAPTSATTPLAAEGPGALPRATEPLASPQASPLGPPRRGEPA